MFFSWLAGGWIWAFYLRIEAVYLRISGVYLRIEAVYLRIGGVYLRIDFGPVHFTAGNGVRAFFFDDFWDGIYFISEFIEFISEFPRFIGESKKGYPEIDVSRLNSAALTK